MQIMKRTRGNNVFNLADTVYLPLCRFIDFARAMDNQLAIFQPDNRHARKQIQPATTNGILEKPYLAFYVFG